MCRSFTSFQSLLTFSLRSCSLPLRLTLLCDQEDILKNKLWTAGDEEWDKALKRMEVRLLLLSLTFYLSLPPLSRLP